MMAIGVLLFWLAPTLTWYSRSLTLPFSLSFSVLALASKSYSSATDITEFTLTTFLIYLARFPNISVETVSSRLSKAGDAAIIRVVLELPPRDSERMRVSLESR